MGSILQGRDMLPPENGETAGPMEEDDQDNKSTDVFVCKLEEETTVISPSCNSATGTDCDDDYVDDTIFSLDSISNLGESPQHEWGLNTADEETESCDNLKTVIEKRRAWSLRMQQQFLQKMQSGKMHATLVAEANLRTTIISKPKKTITGHKRRAGDPTFRFGGYIPAEKRKSARLQKVNPEFSYTDLPDDDNRIMKRRQSSANDLSHIEDIVYQPRLSRPRKIGVLRPPIIPVEDVTDKMLSNIATKSSAKILDTERGTSCHQCRQKTIDTKTCCRNVDCVGVRGQFCGCCIKNRYGEDAAVALLDPTWTCFVCRGICNCSFCRAKAGKKPTGILSPLVQKYGYQSVHQFLDKAKSKATAKDVIGFSTDYAHTKDGKTKSLMYQYRSLKEIAEDISLKKHSQENKENNPNNLLSDTDSSTSDDENVIVLKNNHTNEFDVTSDDNKSETELKKSVDVEKTEEDDSHNNQNGGLLKISTSLFGSGKRGKKPESASVHKKQKFHNKHVIGFSADGKEVVIEGNISVRLQ